MKIKPLINGNARPLFNPPGSVQVGRAPGVRAGFAYSLIAPAMILPYLPHTAALGGCARKDSADDIQQ